MQVLEELSSLGFFGVGGGDDPDTYEVIPGTPRRDENHGHEPHSRSMEHKSWMIVRNKRCIIMKHTWFSFFFLRSLNGSKSQWTSAVFFLNTHHCERFWRTAKHATVLLMPRIQQLKTNKQLDLILQVWQCKVHAVNQFHSTLVNQCKSYRYVSSTNWLNSPPYQNGYFSGSS